MKKLILIACSLLVAANAHALIPLDYGAIRDVQVPDVVGSLSRGLELGQKFRAARQQKQIDKMELEAANRDNEFYSTIKAMQGKPGGLTTSDISELLATYPDYPAQIRQLADILRTQTETKQIIAETEMAKKSIDFPALTPIAIPRLPSSPEQKVYITRVDDDLYKTDDGRLIKTFACYEYVYSEKAMLLAPKGKLLFKNDRTCDVQKVMDF